MWDAGCGMRDAGCGMRDARSEMRGNHDDDVDTFIFEAISKFQQSMINPNPNPNPYNQTNN
jgi:hypothetical protein